MTGHPATTLPYLTDQLTSTISLTPSPVWLTTLLASLRPSTPLPSLLATTRHRILASSLTDTLVASTRTTFPADIHAPPAGHEVPRERRIEGPLAVQVVGYEDIGRSRWEQIEALEASERGEGRRGWAVVRVGEDGEGEAGRNAVGGMWKIEMMDAKGVRVWGLVVKDVPDLNGGMSIGLKMVLRNVVVARGVVLLEPRCVTVLGGRIEAQHKAWVEGRKTELKALIDAERGQAG
ncbi:MAG: hypothetical protein M1833_002331 [Piccolia ochrophora]|nr:MAG: hypothetical protein M1833_002331 [Piccolia ochrophora]